MEIKGSVTFNNELEDGRHWRRHQDHVRSCLSDSSHVFPSFNSKIHCTDISVPSPVATRHDAAQLTAGDFNSLLQPTLELLLPLHLAVDSSDHAGQCYPHTCRSHKVLNRFPLVSISLRREECGVL